MTNTTQKVKVRKVKAKDIQRHIEWIDEQMQKCEEDRLRKLEILREMSKLDPVLDQDRYSELQKEADLLDKIDERYDLLQKQKDKEYEILSKYKNSKFYIPPKELTIIGVVGLLGLFAIALDRENPKALKLVQLLMLPFKYYG